MGWLDEWQRSISIEEPEKPAPAPRRFAPEVHSLWFTVRRREGADDPGEAECCHYIVVGNVVSLTNEKGVVIDKASAVIGEGLTEQSIACALARQRRTTGGFNRKLRYGPSGIV